MRGETYNAPERIKHAFISIHSPHAGRDVRENYMKSLACNFNPLSPCGERPVSKAYRKEGNIISIHSPHAGRDFTLPHTGIQHGISIHSPHAGRDLPDTPAV